MSSDVEVLGEGRGLTPPWKLNVARADRTETQPLTEETGDTELVSAALSGVSEAFDRIVARHQRAVYRLCYRYVGRHEDANDLTQDVFLRAYRGLRKFKGRASFRTWLYRIGVNVCLDRVTSKGVRLDQAKPLDAITELDSGAESASDAAIRHERERRVRAAIAQLPPKQRATLVLRVYQELSHEEIAKILGTSVGACKVNLFHALKRLKGLLQP
jgi:RNA polymerase sigma-70 factor (ECF subfamily)